MSSKNEQGGMDVRQKNVYQKPLHLHSSTRTAPSSSLPPTIATGYCTAQASIAVTLTNSFLDFSASRGLDLRAQGIGPGQRFCIEAARWKDVADSKLDEVPKVKLECTHEKALDTVGLDVLKRFAAEQDVQDVVWPKDHPGKGIRESGEIGGKEPRA